MRAIQRRCKIASANDCNSVRQVAAPKCSIVRKNSVYCPITMSFFTELTGKTNAISQRCRICKFHSRIWLAPAVFGFPCIKKGSNYRNRAAKHIFKQTDIVVFDRWLIGQLGREGFLVGSRDKNGRPNPESYVPLLII